jgi:hypothetical protein
MFGIQKEGVKTSTTSKNVMKAFWVSKSVTCSRSEDIDRRVATREY